MFGLPRARGSGVIDSDVEDDETCSASDAEEDDKTFLLFSALYNAELPLRVSYGGHNHCDYIC